MRKVLLVVFAMALVAVFAMPAMAEFKLNGYYRVKPYVSNIHNDAAKSWNKPGAETTTSGTLTKDSASGRDTETNLSFTEMRARLRFEVGDENVKGVTFFEIDGHFGDTGGKVGRHQGFAANGDSINIETKNVFLWFRIPDTSWDFTVGLQGYSDMFGGFIFGAADQAGVVANFKYEPVAVRLTWLKLKENDILVLDGVTVQSSEVDHDDFAADYYAVDGKFNPTKDATVGLHLAFLRDSASAIGEPSEVGGATDEQLLTLYYAGINGAFNVAPVTLTGGFIYNFGKFEQEPPSDDVKISGFAARLRADLNVGPGKAFLEGLYLSGDDDSTDDKYKGFFTGSAYGALTAFYVQTDMSILFANGDSLNTASGLLLDPNNSNRGILHVGAGYSQKFTDKITGKVGAGYLAANKKRAPSVAQEAKGKSMGTEVNANINYNISKGLDFGVYGAYCFLGKWYDRVDPNEDPNNLYDLHGRLNYSF